MDSAATNDTAPHHDRGWTGLQRAGFSVVLLAAAATLGLATLSGPQDSLTAHTSEATEQETAGRGGERVINGCPIQPGAQCVEATLFAADLTDANLQEADLRRAVLWRAVLYRANLNGADLSYANLFDADLDGANLDGANLRGANLRNADLDDASFRDTVMPDGSRCSGRIADCSWRP